MRREDVPEGLANRPNIPFDPTPGLDGLPVSQRRVALVSTAGLMHRGDQPFGIGASDYRVLDQQAEQEIVMSHISTNFDRSGFVQDVNVVLPLERLQEKAQQGEIGSVARYHYSFMGATAPENMQPAAELLAKNLRDDEVDGLILVPV